MKARRIGEKIWWVGAMDWDRRLFDSLIPLPDGTSYNSYFVQGTRKSALIDSVDPAFRETLLQRLRSLNIKSLDYVVANHIEQDHSGTIPDILALYPMAKAVTSDKGKGLMMDLLEIPEDRILVVQDGDCIDLGEKTLQFIYFPWVHWPETMLTWVPEDKILFSCDLFGSHLATTDLFFADTNILYPAAKRYYAEIMMPFRTVIKSNMWKVQNLNAEIIAPSHGPIYKPPKMIMDAYRDWTENPPHNLVLVPYISMHDSTRIMVDYFLEACADRGINAMKINLEDIDFGKFAMKLVDASGIVFGSPMVLGGPHPKVAYAALFVNALRPKTKFISVIGSFGWGGKLAETLQSLTSNLKAEVLPPVLAKGLPKKTDFDALDALAALIPNRADEPVFLPKESTKPEPQYICPVCHYIYDPEKGDPDGGIAPGTPYENIPDNWVCPLCHIPKRMFKPAK
jgi:flavorubredoxin/rubredoxin